MENNIQNNSQTGGGIQEGSATHSGWQQFYNAYASYRDECIRLGRIVLGTDSTTAVRALQPYHSTIYTLAQQVFSFYDDATETQLTEEWLTIGEEISSFLFLYNDQHYRKEMVSEGNSAIPKKLKISLLKYFNKVDRMATEAGLQVMKESKSDKEPKKGLLGA